VVGAAWLSGDAYQWPFGQTANSNSCCRGPVIEFFSDISNSDRFEQLN